MLKCSQSREIELGAWLQGFNSNLLGCCYFSSLTALPLALDLCTHFSSQRNCWLRYCCENSASGHTDICFPSCKYSSVCKQSCVLQASDLRARVDSLLPTVVSLSCDFFQMPHLQAGVVQLLIAVLYDMQARVLGRRV